MENNKQQVGVAPLSLPKGGGAIAGMGESLGAIGPSGLASLTLPLPISAGRGYAPGLALSYSSGGGNSPFGLGWHMGMLSIRRRTAHGVPHYDNRDEFIGPSGEVLIAVSAANESAIDARYASADFAVTRYQPRIEGGFDRIEFWQPQDSTSGLTAFWLIYSADGQQHCLGKSPLAHIASPDNPNHIAEWLLEESVSPTGEHICYHYQREDDSGIDTTESASHPQASTQRYLQQVRYGNLLSSDSLYAFKKPSAKDDNWLFTLVFDYGERPNSLSVVPPLNATDPWPCRQDPFSRYEYGFEVRTRRLCQQVLMFHNLRLLSGDKQESEAELVARLRFNYLASPYTTQLISCRQIAHEKDGTALSMPPLEFDYQQFEPKTEESWQSMPEWDKFNPYYQLVDLHGEGLPGMLYQDSGSWHYHPPVRQAESENGVSYGDAQILPQIPTLRDSASLMDINGDGRLDWVVSQSGLAGYYSRNPDESWTQFTPLSALPTEYFHPQAQLADLIGDGISDLALIGPNSVRLYANKRDGFAAAKQVYQDPAIALPIPGGSDAELVAFSDPLGSGQQHLMRVRHNSVTCWPNLGHGYFGKPITLSGFSQPVTSFNPQQVWLADIDGSGTADLIYANSDHLLIYRNQSGNAFAEPLKLPLPHGVRYDNTCQLTLADVQGLGVTSLLLSVPHMASRHWRYHFVSAKPYLLSTINNNMGAENRLTYRSSAQFWLDEKAAAAAKGRKIACGLPFPLHLLAQSTQFDEITQNSLSQQAYYYHGFYDGVEREFRGFGRVDTVDTHADAHGSATERTAPSLSRSWFHTGRADDENRYQTEYWQGDKQAYQLNQTRLSLFNSQTVSDDLLTEATSRQHYWLQRALKGSLLRSELYGLDNHGLENLPYTTSSTRYQVRQIQISDNALIVMPMSLEQLDYHYERIAQDPQCSQQIVLRCDEYGHPLHTAAINYPRRPQDSGAAYSWLATDHWASSYDAQQQLLRISESQQSYRHVIEDNALLLGLPWQQRTDISNFGANGIPGEGLNYEILTERRSALGTQIEQVYAGQQEVFYHPDYPLQALVIASESAEFDDNSLTALTEMFPNAKLRDEQLQAAGYTSAPRLFARKDETDVWVARRGLTEYSDANQFYRPKKQRSSALVGDTSMQWDNTTCAVIGMTLADGSTTQADYDYRFITPYQLTDINDNVHYVEFDAFGRVTSSRFWGTELSEGKVVESGFSQPSVKPFTAPTSIDDAIEMESEVLPVAQFSVYQPFSWMIKPLIPRDDKERETLIQHQVMTEEGYLCALGYSRWLYQDKPKLSQELADSLRHPPHAMTVATDRYDNEAEKQQHQQVIVFSDGFGRALQSAQRVEPGEAYSYEEGGRLQADGNGLTVENAGQRWAVSGRVEYDNKGLAVRAYQPYFLNNWRYISDDSARQDTYADTHIYDPLGREIKVITAKGYQRRAQYFPWFVISEDENDTATEVSETGVNT
ncbi:putative insecticidal toxin complex protein [Yersinia thracica]|uniref:Putative insecticidal toxin complex protein n=1 Tax=Yersinia thracica TaxID=2890319 RepID=A0A0T9R130_9GAMM|nr:SpvB/TcaC N-terminal domain-containing protein [Yersinia thracica]CNI39302.1 putative insecticidal toxin complex protein [Yersinia thracica]